MLVDDVIELRDRYRVQGVVVGGLEGNGGEVGIDRGLVELVRQECGNKMKFVFHKASDQTSSLSSSVKLLSEMGVDEILTQGGKAPALSPTNIQ